MPLSKTTSPTIADAPPFQGLPARRLSNGRLSVDFLTTAGPRVVRLALEGRPENLLAETPEMKKPTPWGVFSFRGGHRLWHAPEAFPRTYVPDDAGLTCTEEKRGVSLSGGVEAPTGLQKLLRIELDAEAPRATLTHTIRNEGLFPVEIAAWAITQLPLGGAAWVPTAAPEISEFTPNRSLALWPYASWDDDRLSLAGDHLSVLGEARVPPLKLGTFARAGWAAYHRNGVLFVKRFETVPEKTHADRGSNLEIYVADAFLELETLGPLERLRPGGETRHVEIWEVSAETRARTFAEVAAVASA
jgi:hypothetical protein